MAASNLLRPVLIIATLLNIYDSFFWTISPIYAQTFSGIGHLGGLFLAAYEVPILGIGWYIGTITKGMGKKVGCFLLPGHRLLLLTSSFPYP